MKESSIEIVSDSESDIRGGKRLQFTWDKNEQIAIFIQIFQAQYRELTQTELLMKHHRLSRLSLWWNKLQKNQFS